MRQPCSSRRLVLTLDRATAKVSAISSAGSGWGERNNSACTWATVRLMPQRVPISPQWRMNFWATRESDFGSSVISVYTENTALPVICQAHSGGQEIRDWVISLHGRTDTLVCSVRHRLGKRGQAGVPVLLKPGSR